MPSGPIIDPRPGPTFEIVDADAEIHDKKSSPLKDNNKADIKKVNIYRKKKQIREKKHRQKIKIYNAAIIQWKNKY